MEFAEYQHRLEKQHGLPIGQIMRDIYIEKDYGPATGAQAGPWDPETSVYAFRPRV